MSVWLNLIKVNLDQSPLHPLVCRIYTDNEQLITEQISPCLDPYWELSCIISNKVKIVSISIQERIIDGKFIVIGKADLYLYNLVEHPQNTSFYQLLNLKKILKDTKLINSDLAMFAGTVKIQLSYSLRTHLLGQIEKIQHFKQQDKPKIVSLANSVLSVDKTLAVGEKQYEQISISEVRSGINKSIIKSLSISQQPNFTDKKQEPFFAFDSQGYINLKPIVPQTFMPMELFTSISMKKQQQIPEQTAKQQKMILSAEQLKQYSQLDPSLLRQSAVVKHIKVKHQKPGSKKLQIFQRGPIFNQSHIAVNKATEMFEVYNMCCGQQIEQQKHTLEEDY